MLKTWMIIITEINSTKKDVSKFYVPIKHLTLHSRMNIQNDFDGIQIIPILWMDTNQLIGISRHCFCWLATINMLHMWFMNVSSIFYSRYRFFCQLKFLHDLTFAETNVAQIWTRKCV